jgi:hypothetical protein
MMFVAGTPEVNWFLEGGRLAAQSVRETLEKNGLALEAFSAVLDFGCGCGRVLRQRHIHDQDDEPRRLARVGRVTLAGQVASALGASQ